MLQNESKVGATLEMPGEEEIGDAWGTEADIDFDGTGGSSEVKEEGDNVELEKVKDGMSENWRDLNQLLLSPSRAHLLVSTYHLAQILQHKRTGAQIHSWLLIILPLAL